MKIYLILKYILKSTMLNPDPISASLYPTFSEYKAFINNKIYISDYLPIGIDFEIEKVKDLLLMCYFKSSIYDVAQLQAIMIFEKALRIKLYNEYRTITKIKFSVLIDKAKQLNLISEETFKQFRILKDFRNRTVHQTTEYNDVKTMLNNIILLIETIHQLFPIQEMYFIVSKTENILSKIRYGFSLEDIQKQFVKYAELFINNKSTTFHIVKLDSNTSFENAIIIQ